MYIIIHQTHYEKPDWSRAFNQFPIACELDMINAISAADNAFITLSSTCAWLRSTLYCSPQKRNGWTLSFCFRGWIMWKMYNKTIIEFGSRMISWIIKTSCLCYLPQPSADNTDLGFMISWSTSSNLRSVVEIHFFQCPANFSFPAANNALSNICSKYIIHNRLQRLDKFIISVCFHRIGHVIQDYKAE